MVGFAKISALAIFTLMATQAWSGAGITGADVLRARLSARPAGMGDTYAALGNDAFAIQYNPAGLGSLEKIELYFLHWTAVADVSYDSFGYAQPFDFGTLGLGLSLRGMPDIDNAFATDNPVSASDLVLTLTYAFKPEEIFDGLPDLLARSQLGVNVKYLRSKLGDESANVLAVDLGGRWNLVSEVIFGLSVLNLGTAVKFIDEADPLPSTLLAGLARTFELGAVNRFSTAADLEVDFAGAARMHVGAEDWITKSLALRVGYVFEDDRSLNGMSAGAGLRLDQDTLVLQVDYAFKPLYYNGFDSYDSQHLVSAKVQF